MTRRTTTPHSDIRRQLEARLHDLQSRLQRQMRDVRTEREVMRGRGDQGESVEVDPQHDVDLTIIELQSAMLETITGAIRRIDAGTYGQCSTCGVDIAPARLRALPFASLCRDCAADRESSSRRVPPSAMARHRAYWTE